MSYAAEPSVLFRQAELEAATVAATDASHSANWAGEPLFIERLRAGEAAAFTDLVNEQSAHVYALLYRLTEDQEDARDLTQETFLQAFRHIHRFRGDADLKTWLYRIAVNQARNRWRWWRRRRRDVTFSLDERGADTNGGTTPLYERICDQQCPNPEQLAIAREQEQMLLSALHALARSYREVVVLRDIEGLSYEQVAATLEISVGTVKSRLSRGRTELRRRLAGSFS